MPEVTSQSVNPKRVPRISGLTPSEAVYSLMETFLFAALWGTPDFETLDGERKAEFSNMVSKGELQPTVDTIVTACLQHEVKLNDQILKDSLFSTLKIHNGGTLDETTRKRLCAHYESLYCVYIRLHSEEVVLVSDEFPDPYISGRWSGSNDSWMRQLNFATVASMTSGEEGQNESDKKGAKNDTPEPHRQADSNASASSDRSSRSGNATVPQTAVNKIVNAIKKYGPLQRKGLAGKTGYKTETIGKYAAELVNLGVLSKSSDGYGLPKPS